MCSATADALTSAIVVMLVYVVQFGIQASIVGVFLGWVLDCLGGYASRIRATKPKVRTDNLA